MSKKSAILELQDMARSGSTDIAELLRHAKVIASKLKLDDFEAWIDREKDGYSDVITIPDYRKIPTQLMARNLVHGAIPVDLGVDNPVADYFAETPFPHPISRIHHLIGSVKNSFVEGNLTPPELTLLTELDPDVQRRPLFRRMSTASIAAIPDAVRNKLLDWTLALEKRGILGEGMVFTQQDRKLAASVTINNFGHLVQGDHANLSTATHSPGANVTTASGSAQVLQRLSNAISITQGNDKSLAEALQQAANAINASKTLPAEKKGEATDQLAFVAEQCALPAERRQSPTILKSVLTGLRETLSLGADVLQVWTTFGPIICAALSVSLT